jgi:hypothetical protein
MSNARKIMEKAAPKKVREPRARKVKVNLDALGDAVVDGRLVVPVKGRLIFVRTFGGKSAMHEGYVFSHNEETGDVSVWDETRGQFWCFNAKTDGPRIVCKTLSAAPVDPGTTGSSPGG